MSKFAILRTTKLKTYGEISASLQHAFRERETKNADSERTVLNRHFFINNSDEALEFFREKIQQVDKKPRKDAVRCIELVMSASPEFFEQADEKTKERWIEYSVTWLKNTFGEENIAVCSLHEDETTPHLTVFIVPITKDNRLSAKEYLGGRDKLRNMQTDYWKSVANLGLERGMENSKAKHKTIQKYYSEISELEEQKLKKFELPKLPKPSLLNMNKFTAEEMKDYAVSALRLNYEPIYAQNSDLKLKQDRERELVKTAEEKAKIAQNQADEEKAKRLHESIENNRLIIKNNRLIEEKKKLSESLEENKNQINKLKQELIQEKQFHNVDLWEAVGDENKEPLEQMIQNYYRKKQTAKLKAEQEEREKQQQEQKQAQQEQNDSYGSGFSPS